MEEAGTLLEVGAATLVETLLRRAAEQPGRTAYTFLSADGDEASLTYAALDAGARGTAAALGEAGFLPGDRVLILHPPGLDYVVAFFGCLYAGAIAVPAYPPRLRRNDRGLAKLRAIVADARPAAALTSRPILAGAAALAAEAPELAAFPWLGPAAPAPDGPAALPTRETIAFLQYTSGSTAAPKGVMVSHANLAANLASIQRAFRLDPESRVVLWLPPYHDMGLIGGLLAGLHVGYAPYLLSPTTFLQRPLAWLEAISRHRGTVAGGPNFGYDLCVDRTTPEERATLDLRDWSVAFTGAEPISARTLDRFAAAFAPAGFRPGALFATYGLAEATLMATAGRVGDGPSRAALDPAALERGEVSPASEPARVVVGCGKPVDQRIVVVGVDGSPCPPDRVGELWIAGPNVAVGYWGLPEESAATFGARLPDGDGPFLRTGDLGFVRDGELLVTGRLKDLIIIRGRNLYPQDVEAAADRAHPRTIPGGAAAFSIDVDGEERLVVLVEVQRHHAPSDRPEIVAAVRQAVAEALDTTVHTVALLRQATLPKTTSGKVQRAPARTAYLAGQLELLDAPADPDMPPTEDISLLDPLRTEVARLLDIPVAQIDPTKSLIALALDSLGAAHLHLALANRGLIAPPLSQLLDAPSLADLASTLVAAGPVPTISCVPDDAPIRLAFVQEQIWFADQLDPGTPAHNVAGTVRIDGPLDPDTLERALAALVHRHEALRTTYPAVDGHPTATLSAAPPRLHHVDLAADLAALRHSLPPADGAPRRNLTPPDLDPGGAGHKAAVQAADMARRATEPPVLLQEALQHLIDSESTHRFNLTTGPLLRATLARLSPNHHVLVVVLHHIAADGWSARILARELPVLYDACARGETPALPTPPRRFRDFAHWQRAQAEMSRLDDALAYWREQLAGLPQLELPTDRPSPARASGAVGHLAAPLPAELIAAAADLARRQGTTPTTLYLAVMQALLGRYTGQEEFGIGLSVANRDAPELADVVGPVADLVVLRAALDGDPTFADLLARTKGASLAAIAHGQVPYRHLIADLACSRPGQPPRLFDVSFAPAVELPSTERAGLTFVPSIARFAGGQIALSLTVQGDAAAPRLAVEYDADRFDAPTIERLAGHFRTLLAGAVADPAARLSALPLLPAAERSQLEAWGSGPVEPLPDLCLHELVAAQVARAPDALAVVGDDGALTYAELERRAEGLASRLRRLGVRPGDMVGLCLGRSTAMIAAALAILKSGGAYLPLDPTFPVERLTYMLADSGAAVVVADASGRARLSGYAGTLVALDEVAAPAPDPTDTLPPSVADPPAPPVPSDPAYAIYTSGSTGPPKAVVVTHRNAVNMLLATRRTPGLTPDDVLAAITTLCFDIHVLELFLPLVVGARVVVVDSAVASDGPRLAALLAASRATILQGGPLAWRLLVEANWRPSGPFKGICGGEAMPPALAAALLERGVELWNGYGPTETTVWTTFHRVTSGQGPVPIGRPVANHRLHVLDARLAPLPPGVPGELYVGGDGVARGYLGRPELTAERFVPEPGRPGARMYRTGDRVRWRPDGELEFVGRIDHQIKVNGVRVEPGEVESAIAAHPGVAAAVVVAHQVATGDATLIAYVVPKAGAAPAADELRAFVSQMLPRYVVPTRFIPLPALPLTPNGKLDRAALPPLESLNAERPYVAPRTPTEQALARIWAEQLQVERVGIHDDFFDLGGHSLLALRVADAVQRELGCELPLAALFLAPTIAALAAYVDGAAASAGDPLVVPIQPHGTRAPLFCVGPVMGPVFPYFDLARRLGEQPFYGLHPPGIDGRAEPCRTIEELAARLVEALRATRPRGPYHLGGWSFGGLVAYEMARQLDALGLEVGRVVLIDPPPPGGRRTPLRRLRTVLRIGLGLVPYVRDYLHLRRTLGAGGTILEGLSAASVMPRGGAETLADTPSVAPLLRLFVASSRAQAGYDPAPYRGALTLLRSADTARELGADLSDGWGALAGGGVDLHRLPGAHMTLLREPHVAATAERLRACLDGVPAPAILP